MAVTLPYTQHPQVFQDLETYLDPEQTISSPSRSSGHNRALCTRGPTNRSVVVKTWKRTTLQDICLHEGFDSFAREKEPVDLP